MHKLQIHTQCQLFNCLQIPNTHTLPTHQQSHTTHLKSHMLDPVASSSTPPVPSSSSRSSRFMRGRFILRELCCVMLCYVMLCVGEWVGVRSSSGSCVSARVPAGVCSLKTGRQYLCDVRMWPTPLNTHTVSCCPKTLPTQHHTYHTDTRSHTNTTNDTKITTYVPCHRVCAV